MAKKYWIIFLLFILSGFNAKGQELEWDNFLNDYLSAQSNEEDDNENLSRLQDLHIHPININDCNKEDLLNIPVIEEAEADSIISYQKRYGAILSSGELQLIKGLNHSCRNILPFFVTFGPATTDKRSLPFLKALTQGHQEIALKSNIPFYKRQGYKSRINGRTGKVSPPRYVGDSFSGTLYYRNYRHNSFQLGFTADKDDAEPFAKKGNTLFDSYSFYFIKEGKGSLRKWAVGDYRIFFGKGLTAGIGYMNSGQGLLLSRHDHSRGIFVQTGTDEYRFFRGGAAQWKWGAHQLTAFVSQRKLDGRIQGDSILSLLTSGYHRLPLERERKNNIKNATAGLSYDGQWKQFHWGTSIVYSYFDHTFIKGNKPYQHYYPEGSNFANVGIHYSYERRKLNIGGETAFSNQGGCALLHDTRWQVASQTRLYLQHRYYAKRYQSPWGWAYVGNSKLRNEHGVLIGINWQPFKWLNVLSYADGYRLLSASYKSLQPANCFDLFGQASCQIKDNGQILLRYWIRGHEESNQTKPEQHYATRQNIRLQYKLTFPSLTVQAAFDGSLVQPSASDTEKGGMISTRLSGTLWKFKWETSLMAFHTDSYQSAVYSYQPSLLYISGSSAFYYHGYATTLTLQRAMNSHLDLGVRFTFLKYTNRHSIGSAERTIAGNKKMDLGIQIRWFF